MRWTVPLLCLVGSLASADGSRKFDATYKPDGEGGEWPCIESGHGFTVSHGKFSIPWDVEIKNTEVTIGHIDGTVNADGTTTATVTFLSPPPAEFVRQARDYKVSLDVLKRVSVGVKFDAGYHLGVGVGATLDNGNGCSAEWKEDTDVAPVVDEAATVPEVDCSAKPYKAGAWRDGQPYGEGAYSQLTVTGETARVYKCAHGCSSGKRPGDDDAWTLVGHCAAAALPSEGANRWDAKYDHRGGGSRGEEWRCPLGLAQAKLVVSKGKFSLPWELTDAKVSVGHLDGVIAADGKVTIKPVVTVSELPREVVAYGKQYRLRNVTLEQLRATAPTMTFILDTDAKTNPRGTGRRAELRLGNDGDCEADFEEEGYKHQQFREEDGWRVQCHSDEVWDAKKSYDDGDRATVKSGGVRHQYTCRQGPRCDAGERPDRSKEWENTGRCED